MKIARPLITISLAVLLGSSLMAMKTALEFDDILFDFNEVSTKAKGNAKGAKGVKGGGKEDQGREIDITLQADDSFEAQIFNAPDDTTDVVTGVYARKNEFSKKLTLIPDPAGIDAIVNQYAATIGEELEDEGVTAIVSSLQLTKQNVRLTVKTKKKTGTASARLNGKLRFEGLGSIPEIGVNNVEFRLNANFKGQSANEVLLSDIEVGT